MLTKKYNKKIIKKKNKSKKNKFKKRNKLKKTNKFKKNKLKKTNKNSKSKRNKKIIKQIGGDNTDNYLITGRHGFILRDTSDMTDISKNPMITIKNSMNLITYAEFCSKACNSTINMQQYICNSDNFVGAIDGPNKIYGPGSKIPEIYLIDEGESVIVKSCNDSKPLNLHKLSELINKQVSNSSSKTINLHLLVCLDVFDISNIKNKDNIENNLNYNNLSKMMMLDCNEDNLKINRENPLQINIKLKPNTIIAVSAMSGAKNKLELKFKDNIKSEDKYETYPEIIRQLNVLFKAHHKKQKNELFINWLKKNYYITTKSIYLDNLNSESRTIEELILKISNGYDINQNDNNLYNEIIKKIPEVSNTNDTITIDMSEINISDKDTALIIKKYLFKILNNKINPYTNNERMNESIKQAEKEAEEAQKQAKTAKKRLQTSG